MIISSSDRQSDNQSNLAILMNDIKGGFRIKLLIVWRITNINDHVSNDHTLTLILYRCYHGWQIARTTVQMKSNENTAD